MLDTRIFETFLDFVFIIFGSLLTTYSLHSFEICSFSVDTSLSTPFPLMQSWYAFFGIARKSEFSLMSSSTEFFGLSCLVLKKEKVCEHYVEKILGEKGLIVKR